MQGPRHTLGAVIYLDNQIVEMILGVVLTIIIPIYWERSFHDIPSWMIVGTSLSGLTSIIGIMSRHMLLRRIGSIAALIFCACLTISCHRRNCEAEVAATIITIFSLWNYFKTGFEFTLRRSQERK
jgi:hypothetical protein